MADVERLQVADREIVRLTSDQLRLDLVPGLGGTAISLVRLEDQAEVLWRSPWGLRPAAARPLAGDAESLMLDSLPGGWQTIFPNGGDSAVVNGAEWGFDGEARVAWFDWEQAGSSVILKTRLLRSPFAVTKIISLNADEVTIGETVKNVGQEHVDVMWGSQLILGPAVLGPETSIDTAATLVRPDPQSRSRCDLRRHPAVATVVRAGRDGQPAFAALGRESADPVGLPLGLPIDSGDPLRRWPP